MFTENMICIQNAAWGGWPHPQKDYVLKNHLPELITDLTGSGIKYAIAFVGYWNPTTNDINYELTDSEITTMINALHSIGVKVLAWAEDNTVTPMDVRAANRQNLYNAITNCMAKGYDGYLDDIELFTGTLQDWIDYNNGATTILHGLGKLMAAAVPYDWDQTRNHRLYMDFIVSMFYSNRSTLEDSQAEGYFQENFGQYWGHNTPPASPLVFGIMNYYGNQYPLTWQLNKLGELMKKYPYSQTYTKGFMIWMYEYMGTSPSDWSEWRYWISQMQAGVIPTANTLTVESIPLSAPVTYEGRQYYAPFTQYKFSGQVAAAAPAQMEVEAHHPLIGTVDHRGSGQGYSVYTYTSGPHALASPATVDSIYFYALKAGKVKLAIYSTTIYELSGWGVNKHPYQLLSQSQPTVCSVGWNLIPISPVNLPAGDYFIAIKADTPLMIGNELSDGSSTYWWRGQVITQDYATPFSAVFPTVEVGMGENPAVYIPAAPLTKTSYYFDRWTLDYIIKTSNPLTIDMDASHSLIAYFTAIPPPVTHILSITSNLSGFNATVNGAQRLVPYSEALIEGQYSVSVPSNLMVGSDIYNFAAWGDGPTSPSRTIQLISDMALYVSYVKPPPPPPAKGNVEIHAYLDTNEIVAPGNIVETGESFNTPLTLPEVAGTYVVNVTVGKETKQMIAAVASGQTIRLDFQFTKPTPISPISIASVVAVGSTVGVITFAATRNPGLSLVIATIGGLGGAIMSSRMSPRGRSINYCEVCGAPLQGLGELSPGNKVKCSCGSVYEVTLMSDKELG